MVLLCPAQTVCWKGVDARLVSLTSCGDRWLSLWWCGVVLWCGISSSSKKGKEKLRRHLLAEAGGQLRTPHTVNKKSLLFNFNDEKEKENFGGSEAKRFSLKEYILSKNICAAF